MLGADHVINHRKEDFVDVVQRITGGRLCDIVVDHVGAATFVKSTQCARRGGSVFFFGTTTGDEVTVSLRSLFGRNISLYGVYSGPKRAFLECLRLFPFKLRPVLDSVFPFEDARAAYEVLLGRNFSARLWCRSCRMNNFRRPLYRKLPRHGSMKQILVCLAVVLSMAGSGSAHQETAVPAQIDIVDRTGQSIPLELTFRNEQGSPVVLKQVVTKPTILVLVYLPVTESVRRCSARLRRHSAM